MNQKMSRFIICVVVLIAFWVVLPLLMHVPGWVQLAVSIGLLAWVLLTGESPDMMPGQVTEDQITVYTECAHDEKLVGAHFQLPPVDKIDFSEVYFRAFGKYFLYLIPDYTNNKVRTIKLVADARIGYRAYRMSRVISYSILPMAISQAIKLVPTESKSGVDRILGELERFGIPKKEGLGILTTEGESPY